MEEPRLPADEKPETDGGPRPRGEQSSGYAKLASARGAAVPAVHARPAYLERLKIFLRKTSKTSHGTSVTVPLSAMISSKAFCSYCW